MIKLLDIGNGRMINPEEIASVIPGKGPECSVISMTNGETFEVEGDPETVRTNLLKETRFHKS